MTDQKELANQIDNELFALERLRQAYDELQKNAEAEFLAFFAKFWEKNPGVEAVIWTQYAPYFNDGDPCEFSVQEMSFTNAKGPDLEDFRHCEYEGENEEVWSDCYFGGKWGSPAPEGVSEEWTNALTRLVHSLVLEPVLKSMFSEDSKVIATREGFNVDDFGGCHD